MEQLSKRFSRHISFRETLHTTKHFILEDGDGGHWEDPCPDTTFSAFVTTNTSSFKCTPYQNKIEYVIASGGEVMRASRYHFPNELDK